jgi:cytochrome c5
VIGVVAAFSLAIFVLAMKISDIEQSVVTPYMDEYEEATNGRIQPFGQVYMPGEQSGSTAPTVQTAAEPAPVAAAMTGPQVYNQACLACHGAGIGGAPILGDTDAWALRIVPGIDVLIAHAIDGYTGGTGYMPPKGGRTDLSDEEVAAAVEYMVDEVQ